MHFRKRGVAFALTNENISLDMNIIEANGGVSDQAEK
jgi:hypothetical protein